MKKSSMRALIYSGDLLGVDLGSHSVKLLHLRRAGRRVAVIASQSKEVWKELESAKTEDAQREVYARAVRTLMDTRLFRAKTAALALPGNSVLIRFLDVTNKRRMDAKSGLPEDAVATIPFDTAEAAIDARTRPAGGAPERDEMMLVVAQKKSVADGVAILKAAGLTPGIVINDALAAVDATAFALGPAAGRVYVQIHCGGANTSVCVVEHGVVRAVRVLNVAGAAFTRAVRREFGAETAAAEALKKRHGLSGGGGEEAERVRKALRPVVKDLAVEVRRTIDAFLDKRPHDHPAPETAVLSGGSADMEGLADALAAELSLKVQVLRPLEGAHANPGLRGFDKSLSVHTVAAGLSLSETLRDDGRRGFNLLPRGMWRAAFVNQISSRTVLIAAAVAVVAALIGGEVVAYQRMRLRDEETRFEFRLKQARLMRAAQTRKKESAKPRVVESPFAYLRSLQVTGVFGGGNFVMLSGGDRVFALRSGRLFDENEKEVPGVSARVEASAVVLTTSRGDRYSIPLPK